MTIIPTIEESDRDWDWFAVDPEGTIGHFTTAGKRVLPKTVKQDKEAALQLIDYFFKEARKSVPYVVRPEAEADSGGWVDESVRNRYLKDFTEIAAAGLFSYDTPTEGPGKDYFLVAFPKRPLHINQLPPAVRDLVTRTKSPIPFAKSAYIPETDTRNW